MSLRGSLVVAGKVVAVDVVSGRQTVLLRDPPSTHNSGQAHADLAGPSGAAIGEVQGLAAAYQRAAAICGCSSAGPLDE
jgi:hypothetical protein